MRMMGEERMIVEDQMKTKKTKLLPNIKQIICPKCSTMGFHFVGFLYNRDRVEVLLQCSSCGRNVQVHLNEKEFEMEIVKPTKQNYLG